MRWLCLYLPCLPLDCRPSVEPGPAAVVDRIARRRVLVACDAAATAQGLTPGDDVAQATARCPELRLLTRLPRQERAALRALTAWAGQFGDGLDCDVGRRLLWVCIGPSLRYFGGLDPLLARLRAGLSQLGYSGQWGVAPTREAAALLARLGDRPPVDEAAFPATLAALPVAALPLPRSTCDALTGSGLRRLGEVLAIAPDALARRFGPECVALLRRLTGEASDPRPVFHLPARFQRRFELAGTVETQDALLFPLRRVLVELEGYLRGRDAAVRELRLRFRHEDVDDTVLTLRSTRPLRSAARWLVLLRAQLEYSTLAAPTDEIHLESAALVPLGDTQLALLDDARHRADDWQDVLDRLRARLGDAAVRQLGLRDDHRPERAWCQRGEDGIATASPPPTERPLWLLAPRALDALPSLLGAPERIETGWWDGEDVARDYYRAVSPDGGQWWLYRDGRDRRWYLHGLWA